MSQQFIVFKSNGFKVNTATFEVLALHPKYQSEDARPVKLTEIPSWDLLDIYDVMSEDEKEVFNQLLMRAVRSLPNAS
jgi:hypothetical protein